MEGSNTNEARGRNSDKMEGTDMIIPDLFSFAYVPSWYCQLGELAEMARPEPWRFREPMYLTKNPDTPILERYIHTIFKKQAIDYNEERNPTKAETYFLGGDYEKALNGDDAECLGFEQIADDYRLYQAGKLAALYAGICHFELGDYEQAAKYLNRFSAKDLMIDPAAHQLLGDAYVEMQEYGKAVKAYRAAAKSGNDLIAPISLKKAGLVYLKLENKTAARSVFTTIKNDYPTSQEAQDIDKYIALTEEK